jgi:hypothetical protein
MTGYSALLEDMMGAILAGDTGAAPALLRDKKDFPPSAQLAVYTEGYRLRLVDAVENAYPALATLIGKREFVALAQAFITAHPSRYFNLDKYPVAFAEYVAGASDDPCARDLAALEGAIHDVYLREETPAIESAWAQSQTPATLATAPLALRTAAKLLALECAADDYLTSFRAGEKPPRPAPGKQWLLVLRHKHQVRRLHVEEAEHALLSLLAEGLTLEQAFDDTRLAPYLEQENFAGSLTGWLARWMSEGVLRQPESENP